MTVLAEIAPPFGLSIGILINEVESIAVALHNWFEGPFL
jgi:hypothetical protein